MKNVNTKELVKRVLRKKYFVILCALFTLSVNVFAWFAFRSIADLSFTAKVAAWDVQFHDNNIETQNMYVSVTDMKPGMDTFTKSLAINNNSDVVASFSYEITGIKVLGHDIAFDNQEMANSIVGEGYPFYVTFTPHTADIGIGASTNFTTSIDWPYESTEPTYYMLNNVYDYNSSLNYYSKIENDYVLNNDVTSSNFLSLRNNLYMDKDDTDTYFGLKCDEYHENTGNDCLVLRLKLEVIQKNN